MLSNWFSERKYMNNLACLYGLKRKWWGLESNKRLRKRIVEEISGIERGRIFYENHS